MNATFRHCAVIAAAFLIVTPASPQSVRSGVEAWQKGDYAGALATWRPLAAKGDADAAFNLGQAHRLGRGVPIDLAQAQTLFEQAARKGHVDAATTLGILMFQNGNRAAAMRWLGKAAEAGDARAMLLFGTALYNGDGVTPDPVTAYAYVSRSAAQGLPAATATLADLDVAVPLAQRQQGLALARSMAGAQPAPAATISPVPVKVTPARRPVPTIPAAKPPSTARSTLGPATGKWRVQLGAFGQRRGAEALFARMGGKLVGRSAYYIPAGKVVRLQVGPYESRAAAAAACASLSGQACFAVEVR